MQQLIKKYEEYRKQLKAFQLASFVISWDAHTETPSAAFETRAVYVGKLAEMAYSISVSEDYVDVVDKLHQNLDKLDEVLAQEIKKIKKEADDLKKIPKHEYTAYQELLSQSEQIWAKAKQNNDWQTYMPILEKTIEFNKKLIGYLEDSKLKG